MGRAGRIVAGLFGTLLLCVGVYALAFSMASPAWRYLGGLAFVLLGINAVYGAVTGKQPWIRKIGPLP
jgi:membrane-bound ClpP family serine protease